MSNGNGTCHSLLQGSKRWPCTHSAHTLPLGAGLPRRQRASWLHMRASCRSRGGGHRIQKWGEEPAVKCATRGHGPRLPLLCAHTAAAVCSPQQHMACAVPTEAQGWVSSHKNPVWHPSLTFPSHLRLSSRPRGWSVSQKSLPSDRRSC